MSQYIQLLIDSNRGRYIPEHFATVCEPSKWGVNEEDAIVLSLGPDASDEYGVEDLYYPTWVRVLDNAQHVDADGVRWSLYQGESGDIFAVAYDQMSNDDYANLTGEDGEDRPCYVSPDEEAAIKAMNARGFAVIYYTPAELDGVDVTQFIQALDERARGYIPCVTGKDA